MDLVLILGPHNRKSQSEKLTGQEKYREIFFQKAFKNQEDNQDINPEDHCLQSSKSKFSKFQRQSQDSSSSSSDEN